MQTIVFYSYKGGTGRSLALANAAVYLALFDFSVVALDLDLEAPGLHYKFSTSQDGSPLSIDKGAIDYLIAFQNTGRPPSIAPYVVDVAVRGLQKPLLRLLPAGATPSAQYWSQLSSLDWHQMFHHDGGLGVPMLMEFKARIEEELRPDFLLIDSRTGISDLGGAATTLLADEVVCVVSQFRENLDGVRVGVQSMQRARRINQQPPLEVLFAVSRLPELEGDQEGRALSFVTEVLAEPALQPEDTISEPRIFVLHTDRALEAREMLRVGSDVSPDDSTLLRDYLRLFRNVVPAQSVGPKIEALIEAARRKVWTDPDVAQKDLEAFATSFGRPETYRALLQLSALRNAQPAIMLKTAERMWEQTRDASEDLLWQTVEKTFRVATARRGMRDGWVPRMDFVEAVWRNAGKQDPEFAVRLADAYASLSQPHKAADLLLDVLSQPDWTPQVLAMAVRMLDASARTEEAESLIRQKQPVFETDPALINAWAEHALLTDSRASLADLTQPPRLLIRQAKPILAAQVYVQANMLDDARAIADDALRDALDRPASESALIDAARLFERLNRWDDFEERVTGRVPSYVIDQLRERARRRRVPGAITSGRET